MDRGLVSASDEQQFGPTRRRGRGRPARFYAITAQGRDVFESTYDDVAVAALDYLAEHLGQGAVEDFARIRAAELSQRYSAAGAPADPADRVAVLVELLSADGYAARAEANPLGLQLCQHHCPIAHVAERYGQFCEAERAAFADLLGVHATRLATIAAGSGVCTTLIAEPRRTTTPDDTEASAERNPA
ncbi:MAG: helix-turn-helix transcriptional regulator [Candidatus Nanopelagicales bacterium]